MLSMLELVRKMKLTNIYYLFFEGELKSQCNIDRSTSLKKISNPKYSNSSTYANFPPNIIQPMKFYWLNNI